MSSTDTDDIRTGHDTGHDAGLEENEEYWPREQETPAAAQTTAEAAQSDEASEEPDELEETGEFDELEESESEPELELEDEDAEAEAYDVTPPQPDEVSPQPAELAPESAEAFAEPEGVARPEDLGGRNLGRGAEPLLSADEQQRFLTDWTRIQVSFVEDPPSAVQNADALVQSISTSMLTAIQERSGELAAEGGAAADTEQLRLALRQYRAFIGVLMPEQSTTL